MSDANAISVKAVLLGETGVGKTCIISRFINNTFDKDNLSTTGASYAGKSMIFDEFGGKCIKYEIWDTAGQERYRALTKIFYKDAAVAILVYDITLRKSFEEVKKYWYKQLTECAPKDIVIGLAGNKSDLYDNEQVTEDEARNFADEIGAVFKLTSASTNTGIEDLFKAIGCKVLDPNFNPSGNNIINKITLDKKKDKKKKGCC